MDILDPKAAELESLMAKFTVYKNRGDKVGSEQILAEIGEKFPNDPILKELEAERLISMGNRKAAADLLAEIIQEFPGRVATEKKHAQLVYELGAGAYTTWEEEIEKEIRSTKGAGTAAVLSFILPGAGQIYNEENLKGATFVALAVAFWILLAGAGFTPTSAETSKINGLGWAMIFCILLLAIVSAFEAGSRAGRKGKRVIPPRPVPPVDKPFE